MSCPARLSSSAISPRIARISATLVGSDERKRQCGLRVGEDGGERLIQLVRERAGELRERGHAREVGELLALLARFLLGPPLLGEVANDHEVAGPALHVDGRHRHDCATQLAAAIAQVHLDRAGRPVLAAEGGQAIASIVVGMAASGVRASLASWVAS